MRVVVTQTTTHDITRTKATTAAIKPQVTLRSWGVSGIWASDISMIIPIWRYCSIKA
jgi:hypothetical protein